MRLHRSPVASAFGARSCCMIDRTRQSEWAPLRSRVAALSAPLAPGKEFSLATLRPGLAWSMLTLQEG